MPFQKGQSGNPAGRPRKTDRYAGQITASEDRIADRLPRYLKNLEQLANGKWEQVEEEWVPAGLVLIDEYTTDDKGQTSRAKIRAFPDLEPDELVLVKRRVSVAAPDRQANVYLVNRILGVPAQSTDGDEAPPENEQTAQFLNAVEKAYGTPQ